MQPVLLLDLVGLTARQIGESTPNLRALAARGGSRPMTAILPAVTCSAQATMITGTLPSEHGAVANGWLQRDTMEVALWRQSNALVRGEKVYETARRRDSEFTCAKLFWWWNMGAAVDWSVTPRPHYPADGRKFLAVYSAPGEYGIELESALGKFPFFDFWGPRAGLASSRWITDATIQTLRSKRPTLTMAYLPHLDYDHQRFGPNAERSRAALVELDGLVGELLAAADAVGAEVIAVSEYGVMDVSRPVHVNRALREAGLLEVRETPVGDMLDPFASAAFAVVDHQVAHVYTKDETQTERARRVLEQLPGVADVLGAEGKRAAGLDHVNAGDLVCVSEPDAWFTYYYWLSPDAEPDFARTVDIHRKPGYDPCEMFLDPSLRLPQLRIARRLAQKMIGMRYLMDVIPIAPELIRGSHGRLPDDPLDGPVFLSTLPIEGDESVVEMTSVKDRVLAALER